MRKIMLFTFLYLGLGLTPSGSGNTFSEINEWSDIMQKTTRVYLIPGQGADERLFDGLSLDSHFSIKHIRYVTPEEGTSLRAYARILAGQIDTTENFIIIGVSLGGMIASEMCEFLNPEKVIVISSAKCRSELPGRYTFQKQYPFYKAFTANTIKRGAKIMQPLVEPDRNQEKEIFKRMLDDKDPLFLKRSIDMIVNWERESYDSGIIHIHGDNDHTIPIRNVRCDYTIQGGSHMMTLTEGAEISALLNTILNNEPIGENENETSGSP